MGNPLLLFWYRTDQRRDLVHSRSRAPRPDLIPAEVASTEVIFLVLRRMRAPLIVLIGIFTVAVLGLSLVPGRTAEGQPTRMSLFDAFYFMSYTATTIGYGELPDAFTYAQRLWVTICIYLTVIGWAYAIGTLLSLSQDRAFRAALAVQGFRRRVRGMREPFLIIAGYGQAGRALGRTLDTLGRRFVVLDVAEERIDALDVEQYLADVPGLRADVRSPTTLGLAGLGHPRCVGVLALTDRDEANLAVVMTVSLLRPDVPVIARTSSAKVAERMFDFAPEAVIDPEGRFGDYLALSVLQPSSYQLMTWLMSPPGTAVPARPLDRQFGRWVVYAEGHFAEEMVADLRAVGLQVSVVPPQDGLAAHAVRAGAQGPDDGLLAATDLADAVGLVAGADDDTTNLTLIAAARDVNPGLFVAARQNAQSSAPLLAALGVDSVLVPTDLVAGEAMSRLVTPTLWQFLQEIPRNDDGWAADIVTRLLDRSGATTPQLWRLHLTAAEAPAIVRAIRQREILLGDILRDPQHREHPVAAVPLMLTRGGGLLAAPATTVAVREGDQILMAGRPAAGRALERVALDDAVLEYVTTGRTVPSTWLWRRFARPVR